MNALEETKTDLYIGVDSILGVSVSNLSEALIINFRINYNNCD
jgi:hypothetical protein